MLNFGEIGIFSQSIAAKPHLLYFFYTLEEAFFYLISYYDCFKTEIPWH